MNKDQIRDIVNRSFYGSLEESEADLSALPPGQLQALVRAMSDSMYAVLETMAEEEGPGPAASPAAGASGEEEVLWSGKPLGSFGERYELTTQRLRIYRGIWSRQIEEIDLVRVRETKVNQHLGERMLNVGDVTIISTDKINPELVLNNVKDPLEVREAIRKAYLAEQERRGLRYREDD